MNHISEGETGFEKRNRFLIFFVLKTRSSSIWEPAAPQTGSVKSTKRSAKRGSADGHERGGSSEMHHVHPWGVGVVVEVVVVEDLQEQQ